MNAFEHPIDNTIPPAHTNGALAAAAAAALASHPLAAPGDPVEESRKEKKKKKKKLRKAEEKERHELRERMEAAHPLMAATPLTDLGSKTDGAATIDPGLPIQQWLGPVARTLDTERILTANRSSYMIAINCLMLSIAAHSFATGVGGPLGWALIPLALTNVLSLGFAVLGAQLSRKATPLDELWAMPEDEYGPALAAMLQSKERAYASLTGEVHLLGADLSRRRRHLRTGYNVLLGGVGLSACVLALGLAIGTAS